MFMVRLKLPGGKMTGKQYLALDDIAGEHGNATLRLTTRQSIQFHGIIKKDLRPAIQGMNAALISTLGACGDVNRNVIACPCPKNDEPAGTGQRLADAIAKHLAPRSNAYADVWLNGERISADAAQDDGVEPIYGKVYLPRKFKTAFGLPHDNCVDVYANDLGFLTAIENGRVVGYNVLVGGGMGRTSGNKTTFPFLAKPLCFVEPDEVVATAEAVVKFFRDHGNRADRKRARLKYVISDYGIEKVRDIFARDYFGKPVRLPRDIPVTGVDLHHGWQPQGTASVELSDGGDDFASTVGVGGVVGTQFVLPSLAEKPSKSDLTASREKEFETWLRIYREKMLSHANISDTLRHRF